MKYIAKNPEPQWFIDWKRTHPGATYRDLLNKKKRLRRSLIAEQHALCCYCESRVTVSSSHNEHFLPKGDPRFCHRQLYYDNIFASCIKEPDGDPEIHCGHKKSHDYDATLICPTEVDCASHFKYSMDGKINHTDDRGKVTIDMLKLDSTLLDSKRKALIDDFLALDEEQLDNEIALHLDTSKVDYGEFYTMVEYLRNSGQL